ncbi:hypothetical protein PYW08_015433 [Mythimna loreyi]|uniref:Uncharacterized protein n=1 Tax=Mythimna loreyi TaxID=667449 RepID=A0ACC2QW67_9NEOP|nr:hypothetical protein PYW08_015433 [Mythimna loreyi]
MTNSWGRLRRYTAVLTIMHMISSLNAEIVMWDNCTTLPDDLQSNGPIISPCKKEIILQKGQNYTLKCKGKREVQFKQQEVPEEIIGPFRIESKNTTARLDGEYWFETVLELYNVDQFAIGYYACFDDTVNGTDILNNLTEEPNNTEHITFIYIYVAGSDFLFAPMREVIVSRNHCQIVIECRPTTPDVEVSLMLIQDIAEPIYQQYSPKIGFVIDSDMLSDPFGSNSMFRTIICEFSKGQDNRIEKPVVFQHVKPPPTPNITEITEEYLAGETFTINCTIKYEFDTVVTINWNYPSTVAKETIEETSNEYDISIDKSGGILYKNITVRNATKEHQGYYTCVASNNCGSNKVSARKKYLDKPKLELRASHHGVNPIEVKSKKINILTQIISYPAAKCRYFRDNLPLPKNESKYQLTLTATNDPQLSILNLDVTDSANYTIFATNGYMNKSYTYDLRVKVAPTVDFGPLEDKKYMDSTVATLRCVVIGYPLPLIEWIFSNGRDTPQQMSSTFIRKESVYKQIALMEIPVHASGNITCKARNGFGERYETRRLLVYEMNNGFGIRDAQDTWFSENQDVSITCIASKYDFSSVTWLGSEEDLNGTAAVQYANNEFSLIAKLKFPSISLNQSGSYSCRAKRFNGTFETESIYISVAPTQAPVIYDPVEDQTLEVLLFQPVQLTCQAKGVPPPKLEWHKDQLLMTNDTNAEIYTEVIDRTVINSTIVIKQMVEEDKGTYECIASNDISMATRVYTLALKEPTYAIYLSVILVVIFFLILVVVYLTWKVHKSKKFKKELAAAGLFNFNKGGIESLNPDLAIDEQAELLPYDEKFEFPADKLIFGKQLGSGAFGVVYKAEARGIINAEETTEVAVKMVKKTADNMYIKALASELKIMVHLGKHINIVNLLGACTKNVGKRELIVIVEYCKFGNIHNYMQRHREVFIDQLTDNKEKNFGRVNRGFSCSGGSTGAHSNYFASSTQDTDHTFVDSANTNRSTRKVSEGYVQPEWRTNYESDYSFDGRNPRPLTSRDLLVWAFQIARGMEYLASRKVLHGDLAARNVLLAEDNIVKICDFGLARSIYKNDEYQKKENCLLPVKWLAIECMTDRIFSTQSDVWSFGIVLWELFSLAKTPYPNISPAALLQWLSEGKRLAKPNYADDRLYNVMLKCWEQKPTSRPTFSQLQEILGGFLEDNVRNHYVDLNTAYMDTNVQPGGEDYLAMVCAPDYNNLVTPSPHHYVNERSFFPTTPTQIDGEGYLQMSPASKQNIFSPRDKDTQFEFDPRMLYNQRVSEASSGGSELTPMLTLNNLPARSGSESDHEGNQSPYLNMCPRIDEETDDVFATNQNNAKNALNTVTNPTYITLDGDIEKKPKDIINSYINVPNGLVK